MKIEDLRLGNYYSYYDGTCIGYLLGISYSSFSTDAKFAFSVEGGGWTQVDEIEDLKPIQLSEEWLLKCGGTFKSYGYGDDEWKSWNINGESFRQNGNGITYTSGDIDINYLHELQDLFYILKKELKIK
jgi:hypothetical protein